MQPVKGNVSLKLSTSNPSDFQGGVQNIQGGQLPPFRHDHIQDYGCPVGPAPQQCGQQTQGVERHSGQEEAPSKLVKVQLRINYHIAPNFRGLEFFEKNHENVFR